MKRKQEEAIENPSKKQEQEVAGKIDHTPPTVSTQQDTGASSAGTGSSSSSSSSTSSSNTGSSILKLTATDPMLTTLQESEIEIGDLEKEIGNYKALRNIDNAMKNIAVLDISNLRAAFQSIDSYIILIAEFAAEYRVLHTINISNNNLEEGETHVA